MIIIKNSYFKYESCQNLQMNFVLKKNEIISDNYKITKDQKIGIIPPIGGG